MQLNLSDFLSVRNEVKMCKICTSNVSCGIVEMVSGATGGEFLCNYGQFQAKPRFLHIDKTVTRPV